MGFWTTRFVEAQTAYEAEERAVALVRGEIDSIALAAPTHEIRVAEVWDGSSSYSDRSPGTGFTWFTTAADEPSCDAIWEIRLESRA